MKFTLDDFICATNDCERAIINVAIRYGALSAEYLKAEEAVRIIRLELNGALEKRSLREDSLYVDFSTIQVSENEYWHSRKVIERWRGNILCGNDISFSHPFFVD